MIIEILQKRSKEQNLFEFSENGKTLYIARLPWQSVTPPLPYEKFRTVTLDSPRREQLFSLRFRPFEEIASFPFATGKRYDAYDIIGKYGVAGSFYAMSNGRLENEIHLACQDKFFTCYDRAHGARRLLSVFHMGSQRAQITSPLAEQGFDRAYTLHIAPGFEYLLPLLCFFTLYWDFALDDRHRLYPRTGTVSWEYSFKADHHDPHWIETTFGREEALRLNAAVKTRRSESLGEIKRSMKFLAIFSGIIAAIVFGIIAASYFGGW